MDTDGYSLSVISVALKYPQRTLVRRMEVKAKDTVTFKCICASYDLTPCYSPPHHFNFLDECDAYNQGKQAQAEITWPIAYQAGERAMFTKLQNYSWQGIEHSVTLFGWTLSPEEASWLYRI